MERLGKKSELVMSLGEQTKEMGGSRLLLIPGPREKKDGERVQMSE